MEAPLQALKNLGVKIDHIFSCDIDHHVKKTIMENFPPKHWYPDLTTRDNTVAPKVDLYVAGFPCQPFSYCGLRQGFKDKKGRGTILFDIYDYIEEQKPRVFVLENVVGILRINNGETWKQILETLNGLCGSSYEISFGQMNTKNHGVPQNRARIYIVGVQKKFSNGTFDFADIHQLPLPSIECFLDPKKGKATAEDLPPKSQGHAHRNVKRLIKELKQAGNDPLGKDTYVIDCDSTEKFATANLNCAPCITRRRGGGHWLSTRGRRTTKEEMMRLQGMKPEDFKVVVSENQWGQQIGNSMSVNVLERIFVRLLPSANLVPPGKVLKDRWEAEAKKNGFKVSGKKRCMESSSTAAAEVTKRART